MDCPSLGQMADTIDQDGDDDMSVDGSTSHLQCPTTLQIR